MSLAWKLFSRKSTTILQVTLLRTEVEVQALKSFVWLLQAVHIVPPSYNIPNNGTKFVGSIGSTEYQLLGSFFSSAKFPSEKKRNSYFLILTCSICGFNFATPNLKHVFQALFLKPVFRGSFLLPALPELREVIPTALWYKSFNLGILITSATTETPTIRGNTGAGVSSCL